MTTIGTWFAVTVGDVGTWHEITRVAIDQATRAAAASMAGAAIVVEGADLVIRRFTCSGTVVLTPVSSTGQALALSHQGKVGALRLAQDERERRLSIIRFN